MFHFRGPVDDWPRAAALLPNGYVIKSIDDVQMLAQTKSINPNLLTILRHWYQAQVPGDSVQDNYQRARDFFDSFIDGTFMNGETHGWNHAAATNYIEGWNEYFGNSQNPEERQRFIYWAQAAAQIWLNEYRTLPGLEHIKLILANTAIGNDIPIEVAQAAVDYDCLLGYHPYWPTRYNQVPPAEWPWYSGRWTQMDAYFQSQGLHVKWAFTEAGAILYRGDWPEIGLNPNDGWVHNDVHGNNVEEYITTITRWMNLWHSWNSNHGSRALPPVLFDSSRNGWELFQIHQPNLDRIAQHVAHWQPGTPPPTKSLEEFLWDLSVARQPISLNADALLQKTLDELDRTIVESEEYVLYPGDNKQYAYQAGEDPTGVESRLVAAAEVPEPGQPWAAFTFDDPHGSPPLGLELQAWPTNYKVVTQGHGDNPPNYSGYCEGNLCLPGHNGIDIRAPLGDPFFAAVNGRVSWVSDQRPSGGPSDYGWHIRIESLPYTIIYAHAAPNPPVSVGELVLAGELIGHSGDTGNSYGPHLHFEMRHCGLSGPEWPWCIIDATPYLAPLMNN